MPKMKIPKGISPKTLSEMNFKTLDLPPKWQSFLGNPPHNFNLTIFGGEGSGKSTFSLMFADMLQQFGKVAYFPTEEKKSLSLQQRVDRLGIEANRLLFYPTSDLEVIVEVIRRAKPRFIIIDSADDCGLTSPFLQDLKEKFKGRKAFITVVQSTFKKGTKFGYNGDMSISVVNGMAVTKKNRFSDLAKFKVFDQWVPDQPNLFNQAL